MSSSRRRRALARTRAGSLDVAPAWGRAAPWRAALWTTPSLAKCALACRELARTSRRARPVAYRLSQLEWRDRGETCALSGLRCRVFLVAPRSSTRLRFRSPPRSLVQRLFGGVRRLGRIKRQACSTPIGRGIVFVSIGGVGDRPEPNTEVQSGKRRRGAALELLSGVREAAKGLRFPLRPDGLPVDLCGRQD